MDRFFRKKSLRAYLLGSSVIVSLLIFIAVYIAANIVYREFLQKQALETSRAISKQTFNSMTQVMLKGWTRDELNDFIHATQESFAGTQHQVDIYRGDVVTNLFGRIDQKPMDETVRGVFQEGKEVVLTSEAGVRTLHPLQATDVCLQCHVNAKAGDVLGVIDVRQDLGDLIKESQSEYMKYLLVIAPIPFIVAMAVAIFMIQRINRSINAFQERVEQINSVREFKKMELENINLGFTELNRLFRVVRMLSSKLKSLAVDREILEFEIKLLEKFVITSEVVSDWREYVRKLLIDINTIFDAYSLFTIFRVEDEGYDLEIFWRAKPSQEVQTIFEEIAKRQIQEHPHFQGIGPITINHNISNTREELQDITREDLEVQMKSLLLTTPKIGGVVGIGVQSEMVIDPIRTIVIESILTTLINVVGSVKAIYKYTKDLEYYATRDPLTNLYNQRVFWEMLDYEIKRAQRHNYRFGLLVIDLDNFKTINDRYGHSFGDDFLIEFTRTLGDASRPEDILARYGGDEFVVILPEAGDEETFLVAQRIREQSEKNQLVSPDGTKVRATTSIGIAIYPDHATEAKDLFLIADNMMYKAKRGGKNQIEIPSDEDVVDVYREVGEKSIILMNALEGKQIIPFFQPIIQTGNRAVEIHELLMRLDIDGSLMTAGEFVDIAEGLGIMHKLDYVLIEKAFTRMKETDYRGLLFINLSPKALILGEFIANVRKLAYEFDIDPANVVFEITERDTVKNMELLEKFVQELKFEGFKFAIDDFGSGFSSFHYIKRFPIDYIKIEGEFVRNMLSDPKDRAFVLSIVTLAKELNIKTVAEYVETPEVMQAIEDLDITFAQGFFVGRPGPTLFPCHSRLELGDEA